MGLGSAVAGLPRTSSWAIVCRPSGAGCFFLCLPTACAVGCILSPLCGWGLVGTFCFAHLAARRSSGAEARFVFYALRGAEAAALPRYSEASGRTRARSRTTSRSRTALQESVVPHPFARYAKGWATLIYFLCRKSNNATWFPTLSQRTRKDGPPSFVFLYGESKSQTRMIRQSGMRYAWAFM
jgi:hypothetical protein